jgi:hypothetical protein
MLVRTGADGQLQSHRMKSARHWRWMGAIAIVAITAIAYIPSMQGGFIWDDDDYVVNRTVVHDPGGLDDIWFQPRATPQYYPMVFTTFWIEHRLWGLHPTGYHIVNVALHILNSLLLWLILRRLGFGDAVSWAAAAIFAVHPVHVESVAWITERKNVLSGLFYLASGGNGRLSPACVWAAAEDFVMIGQFTAGRSPVFP